MLALATDLIENDGLEDDLAYVIWPLGSVRLLADRRVVRAHLKHAIVLNLVQLEH